MPPPNEILPPAVAIEPNRSIPPNTVVASLEVFALSNTAAPFVTTLTLAAVVSTIRPPANTEKLEGYEAVSVIVPASVIVPVPLGFCTTSGLV